jgi:hypothetical protein
MKWPYGRFGGGLPHWAGRFLSFRTPHPVRLCTLALGTEVVYARVDQGKSTRQRISERKTDHVTGRASAAPSWHPHDTHWHLRGTSVVPPWNPRGTPVAPPWHPRGTPVAPPWNPRGTPVAHTGALVTPLLHPLVPAWFLRGSSVAPPWHPLAPPWQNSLTIPELPTFPL